MKIFILTLLSALAFSITASFAGNTPVAQEEAPAPIAQQQEIVAPQPKTCSKEEKGCDIAEPTKEETVEVVEEVAQNPAVQQSAPIEQTQSKN